MLKKVIIKENRKIENVELESGDVVYLEMKESVRLDKKELEELADAILDETNHGGFNTFNYRIEPKNIFDKIDEYEIDEVYNQVLKGKLEGKTSHYHIKWKIIID